MQHDYDAIVIGAGHNGLTAAAYMAKAGLKGRGLRKELVGGRDVVDLRVRPGLQVRDGGHVLRRDAPADQAGPRAVRARARGGDHPPVGLLPAARREVLHGVLPGHRQDLRVPRGRTSPSRTPSRTASGPSCGPAQRGPRAHDDERPALLRRLPLDVPGAAGAGRRRKVLFYSLAELLDETGSCPTGPRATSPTWPTTSAGEDR